MGREILDKLSQVLRDVGGNNVYEEEDFEDDDVLIERMFDLIEMLDPEQLTEDQADVLYDIFEMLAPEEETNEVFKRRVRRDISARRKRRREYRRKRAQVKIRARKYRRSATGKKTLRKAKRFGKFGRTSTGARQRKFIGPK